MTPSSVNAKKAIGIVRVSQVAGREGDSFASPTDQRQHIEETCQREGLKLVAIHDELDVSGGAKLEDRHHLLEAVEAVEAGKIGVVISAYFDRLVRSLDVKSQIVERVESAGGRVLTFDHGEITHKTAGQWLSSTLIGAINEHQRRIAKERSGEAQRLAVARGVVPFPNIGVGYVLQDDGTLAPHPTEAPVVADGFRMRAEGATIAEVRAHLKRHGIERSYHGVHTLLRSRLVLGEIHFGDLVNTEAHEPIVDRETWQRVQDASVPRGPKPKSERLLSRLGVLRCGTCGGRMVVGMQKQHGRNYPFYRCGHVREDCNRRVTISARIAEEVVIDRVREVLFDTEGQASAERNARDAEAAVENTQADLDAAIRTLAGFEDEDSARQRLAELRQARDDARERLAELGGQGAAVAMNAAGDWDDLSLDERRALVSAVVRQAVVAVEGKGAERLTLELFV